MLTPKRLAAALRDIPPSTTAPTTRSRRSSESAIPAASFARRQSSSRSKPIRESLPRFNSLGDRSSSPLREVPLSVHGWREADGDDDGGGFGVDDRDQAENQQGVDLQDENEGGAGLCALSGRPLTVERAHQDAEIEAGDMDQISLVHVLASAQPRPSHAAAIEDMGERTLDQFAAPAHGLSPDPGFQPGAVGVDGSSGRLVAMPAEIALGRLGSAMRVFHTPSSIAF